ncbi:fumarylacetoacetate hydrolase family protein [Thalassotalea hakodatensis]|uniref:fumarylacetoacetate hydrolase family protein n=1 Tax=Thalassotalea hakodatensis TaxID=3030492 RepID=UPI002572E7DE|nr:fumarylacetoacetate hydrolase family protein [Thalassotalea hakodatensis]
MNLTSVNTVLSYSPAYILPEQCNEGTWVGRVWLPAQLAKNSVAGPRVVSVSKGQVFDLSDLYLTMSDLFSDNNRQENIKNNQSAVVSSLDTLLAASLFNQHENDIEQCDKIRLLAPNDIQATKACGVTFTRSLLERVIEEQARGDAAKAADIRRNIINVIGENLSDLVPGSPQAQKLKDELIEQGVWSQYLEVGIGPDAEVFTKAQPLSSVTSGAQIGIRRQSIWNNPEPEIVLAVSSEGEIIGATLGNDVNLRDVEGRSALLLGKAKDNNGASAIGPLIRLFDDTFTITDVEQCEVSLTITGTDGFTTSGKNLMSEISRSPQNLVEQTLNDQHQYPDGMMLYVGTMFAPTEDRHKDGNGFTHLPGDRVEISTPKLGTLVNWVNYCDAIPPWKYGVNQFIKFLRQCR